MKVEAGGRSDRPRGAVAATRGQVVVRAYAVPLAATIMAAAMLSGCAVAMLGGAARSGGSSAGTASTPARGTSGGTAAPGSAGKPASQPSPDRVIADAVKARLAANPALKALNIVMYTHDGVVTLRGDVNSVEQRKAAEVETRAVRGVKGVINQLLVRQ